MPYNCSTQARAPYKQPAQQCPTDVKELTDLLGKLEEMLSALDRKLEAMAVKLDVDMEEGGDTEEYSSDDDSDSQDE